MRSVSQKISNIVAPDEVEAYVKMPDYLMQGCRDAAMTLSSFVQTEETILPTTAFMRECFCFLMSARTIRKDGFPVT